jgi:hypothetical protein
MVVTLTIRFSEDEHAKLSTYAHQHGCSLVDAVRRMMAGSIDHSAADGLTPGLFDSGDPALTQRVDEELANGFGESTDV